MVSLAGAACGCWIGWWGMLGAPGLESRYTYLGDIVIVALHILEAEFLGGADIPICWLVGLGFDNRTHLFLS